MEFERVAKHVDGIPNMSRKRGRRVYDHLREAGAREVLELGTAHGVSAAYMAAAVEDRGGHVTTVDHVVATQRRDPPPAEVIERAGLSAAVDRVLVEDSSYTWWLGQRVQARTTDFGCEPLYDFVYVDGAHNWTIDGLAFFLIEKLLVPNGWVLFDDLAWSYGDRGSTFGPGQGPDALGLSADERTVSHVKLIYELLVVQHPGFTGFLVEDEDWGWAQKAEMGSRTVRHVLTSTMRERVGARIRRSA